MARVGQSTERENVNFEMPCFRQGWKRRRDGSGAHSLRRPALVIRRRSAPVVRRRRCQLAGGVVAFGFLLVAWIAARLEVAGRGRPTRVAGFDVITFVSEPIAAVDTLHAVKVRWRAEL